jgi:hypothetical protein
MICMILHQTLFENPSPAREHLVFAYSLLAFSACNVYILFKFTMYGYPKYEIGISQYKERRNYLLLNFSTAVDA